jgi:hypothetical protein
MKRRGMRVDLKLGARRCTVAVESLAEDAPSVAVLVVAGPGYDELTGSPGRDADPLVSLHQQNGNEKHARQTLSHGISPLIARHPSTGCRPSQSSQR